MKTYELVSIGLAAGALYVGYRAWKENKTGQSKPSVAFNTPNQTTFDPLNPALWMAEQLARSGNVPYGTPVNETTFGGPGKLLYPGDPGYELALMYANGEILS